MPITRVQDVVDELEQLRSEIIATLEHQTQLESENWQRQQRKQEFLDRVPDTK
jgi:hypothetical protein